VIGDRLREVAGGAGDHPTLAILRGQRRQLVASAALLERAGVLQVLELHEHVGAGHQRKRLRIRRGRANDGTLDRRVAVSYVVRSYRQRHAVMVRRASYEMSWPTAWMTSPARPPTT